MTLCWHRPELDGEISHETSVRGGRSSVLTCFWRRPALCGRGGLLLLSFRHRRCEKRHFDGDRDDQGECRRRPDQARHLPRFSADFHGWPWSLSQGRVQARLRRARWRWRRPYRTEGIDGGIRIYTGDADVFSPCRRAHFPGLPYETARQIRFFDDHDELYWNVTGTEWSLSDRGGVRHHHPAGRRENAGARCLYWPLWRDRQECPCP